MIWIEVPYPIAFGYNPPPITLASAHRLKLNEPAVVQKFQDEYAKGIAQHDLFWKVEHLYLQEAKLSQRQEKEFNGYLILCNQLLFHAENKCHKLKCGNVGYTPKYMEMQKKAKFWNLLLQRKQGK
jgi:hypothetical protein